MALQVITVDVCVGGSCDGRRIPDTHGLDCVQVYDTREYYDLQGITVGEITVQFWKLRELEVGEALVRLAAHYHPENAKPPRPQLEGLEYVDD